MFADSEQTLLLILGLVEKCPEKLQEKCFELLLKAYLDSKSVPNASMAMTSKSVLSQAPEEISNPITTGIIPESLKTRFGTTAQRIGVSLEQLSSLFDFQLDPYNFHALIVPGDNKADKTRNVALLLSAKSYLLGADWTADWKEFRAACIDQACWDKANTNTQLSKSAFFKKSSAAEGITLNSKGIEAAQSLLARLINGGANVSI